MRSAILIRPAILATALLLSAAACSAVVPHRVVPPRAVQEVAGRLEDGALIEASGLARSQRYPGILWIINDNGAKAIVHAVDQEGARLGEFKLKKSRNKDWEDLASFRREGKSYLMIADIGDNEAKRRNRTLYFVSEPKAKQRASAELDWQVQYEYPDGARDAEAAAVDIKNQRALILSKRDIPPRLYSLPLAAEPAEVVTATLLGTVDSLHKPTVHEIDIAPKNKDWFWQPVGMDISADDLGAVILTYRAVYYYEKQPEQTWLEALNGRPVRVPLGDFLNAEAIAFGDDKRTVFVTGENKHSRLLRFNFNTKAIQ